jgi:hypothetical protein
LEVLAGHQHWAAVVEAREGQPQTGVHMVAAEAVGVKTLLEVVVQAQQA